MERGDKTFRERYSSALRDFLDGSGETGLEKAYEIGREAVSCGFGIVEIVTLHGEEIAREIARRSPGEDVSAISSQGLVFLTECISPYEMTQRGYSEAIRSLQGEIVTRGRMEETLRQANRKLNMLSSITRHDILNQLLILMGFIELSRKKIGDDEKLLSLLEKEMNAARTIQKQIEFTRFYQDIGVHEAEWQDVAGVIGRAASHVSLGAVVLTISTGNLSIFADLLIEKVFYNLMENSLRHGGHVTEITFSVRGEGENLCLLFSDNGIGIDQNDKEKVFLKGFGKNTGFGLFLSREILSITGISIREAGDHGKGALFVMVIPKGGYRFTEPGGLPGLSL